jgi:IS30 family transposase
MEKTAESGAKKTYKHLIQKDRDRIQNMLDDDVCEAEIARIIGRDKATIGREVKRNCRKRGAIPVINKRHYQSTSAEHKAYVRRKYAKYQGKKIQENDELRKYIIQGLKKHWNPDEISGAMKEQELSFHASKTAIYEWLYSAWGQRYCKYLYAKRSHPKPRKPKAERVMIPDRVSINERPAEATDRAVYGHHEGDTMVSGKKTGSKAALAVDVERKARFISARTLKNMQPKTFNDAMLSIQSKLTNIVSRTYDNGIENKDHAALGIDSYFCDPYSSWQKGGIENGNKMIRRYYPKGMDLGTITERQLQRTIAVINNKPRKILGYKSALQVMQEGGLLRQTESNINNRKVALGG